MLLHMVLIMFAMLLGWRAWTCCLELLCEVMGYSLIMWCNFVNGSMTLPPPSILSTDRLVVDIIRHV